ncbi:MAG: hypothetical protein WAN30_03990 [Acidimicrobiales bacterium]
MSVGVRWYSVGPGSGFGTASEAYISGLRRAGVPVTWTPLGWPSEIWRAPYGPTSRTVTEGEHADIAWSPIVYDSVLVHSTPLWNDRLKVEADRKLLVAFTAWESDRLSDDLKEVLAHYDLVLVPSEFNVEILQNSGLEVPVRSVPHIARSIVASRTSRKTDVFTFYTIATWTSRKAILDTVSAFCEAFRSDDAVSLVIHTTPEDLVALDQARRAGRPTDARVAAWFSLARAVAGMTDRPDIILSTDRLSPESIDALHLRGDCFVSLSRGEAWSLAAFDAAAAGNPVVVTGWGGTREFLPEDYPYFVEYDLVPTTDDPPDAWWTPRPGERWAKARVAHAATMLRNVFDDQERARATGTALRSHVLHNYSSNVVTSTLIDRLRPSPVAER